MPIVEWKPEFSVENKRFDEDHRHLFLLLSQLQRSMAGGQGNSALILTLARCAHAHFKAEEMAMQRYGYPELASHVAEHDRFTQQILQFVNHFHAGRPEIIVEASGALQECLAQHILQSDVAYASFFETKDAEKIRALSQIWLSDVVSPRKPAQFATRQRCRGAGLHIAQAAPCY